MRAKMILCSADAIRRWARRAAGLLCLVGLGLGVSHVRAQPARAVVPHSATESHWALLVGVDPSAGGASAVYRANDVELLAATLRRCGYSDHRILAMTNKASEPDFQALRASLTEQVPRFLRKIGAEDRLLVYLAGGAFRDAGGQLYFAPGDWDAGDPASTGLAVVWLREQLAACPAQVKVLVIDADEHESANQENLVSVGGQEIGSALDGMKGLVVFASCRKGESSLTWEPMGQSLFGFWLAQALAGHADRDGNELVSIAEFYDYVFERVVETAKLVFDQQQTPMRITVQRLPETPHMSRRTSLTLEDALEAMAEDLTALAGRNRVSRLGVTEFRTPGSDSQTLRLLGGGPGILGRWCAVELERRLAHKAATAGGPFELVPHDELHATLARGGFSPASLRTSAARGITVQGKEVQAAVLGSFCACTGQVLTLRCDLQHTRSQRLLGRVQATALLSASEEGMLGRSGVVKPEALPPPAAPSPENPVPPGEQDPERPKLAGSSETPPPLDPDFLYRVKIYVGDQHREGTFLGNDEYVPLEQGEVYEIEVENASDEPVWMRLLVDGLNILDEPVPGEVGADGQRTVVYLPHQRVSLDKARAWQPQPHTRHRFRGFYHRLADARQAGHGEYEWETFKVVDAPKSLAYQQGYSEQIGLITAAFYAYEPPEKEPAEQTGRDRSGNRSRGRGIGTTGGEKGQGEVPECQSSPVGRPLGIINIYYVEPEALQSLTEKKAAAENDAAEADVRHTRLVHKLQSDHSGASDLLVTVESEHPYEEPFRGTLRMHGTPKAGDTLLGAICLTGTQRITIRAAKHGGFVAAGTAYVGVTRPHQAQGSLDFAFTVPNGVTIPQWVVQRLADARKRYPDSVFLMMTRKEFCGDEALVFLGELYYTRGKWIIASP